MLRSEARLLPAVQTNGDASAKETFSDAKHGLSGENLALLRKSEGKISSKITKLFHMLTGCLPLPQNLIIFFLGITTNDTHNQTYSWRTKIFLWTSDLATSDHPPPPAQFHNQIFSRKTFCGLQIRLLESLHP